VSATAVDTPLYRAGDWYTASGITGRMGEELVKGGFEEEFACILRRFKELLEAHNLPCSSVPGQFGVIRN
jgi:hypothetical protein